MKVANSIKSSFSQPVLTPALLAEILAGKTEVDPLLEQALRGAACGQRLLCPYCLNRNDGILRIKSCGMGVESTAQMIETLMTPSSRDYCLCQLVVMTMQTGDEWRDTITNMERFILPLYRYYRIRFVELARGGAADEEGIVVLQDTRTPTRLYPEGYYKLSTHLLANATVPQVGSSRLCSIKFKGWVGEYWLKHCLGLEFYHHLFGFNAFERERARDCTLAVKAQNREALSRHQAGLQKRRSAPTPPGRPPRVRRRVSGDCLDNYQLVELTFEEAARPEGSSDLSSATTSYMIFGFSAEETARAADATRFDQAERLMLCGQASEQTGRVMVITRRPLQRVALFPLIDWGWSRLKCLLSIYLRLGVKWEKSACGECPFDKEGSKCTAKGRARRERDPETTARTLLIEYGSLCLNERGMLYARKSFQAVVIEAQLLDGMQLFEERLARLEFSLFEVKRIYTQRGKAARSVIRLASGTRAEMNQLFAEELRRLRLKPRQLHGITYGLFAERGEEYPALEGFLVVAPAHINEKVRGEFSAFEERFAHVARERGIPLPILPGTRRVQSCASQKSLFT